MNDFEIDTRRLNLLKRSNKLLEKTRTNYKKYENERKLLLKLTKCKSIDYDEWEKILKSIEKLVDTNSK